ncbi:MAG: hypothetical protein J3K34DRAFT_474417 [Monoraphidium minutum]|nr:MAG: hypothetical protein J3K34DRAFT_474417 [Monoraphidium minutum]
MAALARLARRTGEAAAVDALLEERPMLLQLQITSWIAFLSAYGVKARTPGRAAAAAGVLQRARARDCDVVKLLVTSPDVLQRSNVHSAGEVILAFKQLGWSDHHIASRLVPLYPRLLANSVPRDMQPVVDELERAGCRGEHLRLIAWEVPKVFTRHTFRRYLRQFQALGVYGLSRDRCASQRAVHATMLLHPFG